MLLGLDSLGEQTLNRIAEMALTSQLDQVDDLNVQIKTNLDLLAKGQLSSMLIDGQGLVMQQKLRMQRMTIHIGEVTVNPMTALLGNIQLTRPAQGQAQITLTSQDLDRAFNAKAVRAQMQHLAIASHQLDVRQIRCQLLDGGHLNIRAAIALDGADEQWVEFQATPTIAEHGRRVHLDRLHYLSGQGLPTAVMDALVHHTMQVLDLSNFEMDGIALELQRIQVSNNRMVLEAIAHVTRFPKL